MLQFEHKVAALWWEKTAQVVENNQVGDVLEDICIYCSDFYYSNILQRNNHTVYEYLCLFPCEHEEHSDWLRLLWIRHTDYVQNVDFHS